MGTTSTANGVVAGERAISTAALQLFRRQGYEATSVEQIARAAGVSRATVFRRCGSKEDILFRHYQSELDGLREELRSRGATTGTAALRRLLMELAERLEANAEDFRAEVNVMGANPKLRGRALTTLHGWAEQLVEAMVPPGSDRADLQGRVLAHSAVSALHEAICLWSNEDSGRSLVDLADEALRIAIPRQGRR